MSRTLPPLQPVVRDDATAEFFDAAAKGLLLFRRCRPYGHASRPQATICSQCASQDLTWEPASGAAKLVSWAVLPGRAAEGGEPSSPAVVAIAELDEGPWIWACLRSGDPEQLYEGIPLRVGFERPPGSEAIPVLLVDGDKGQRA